METLRLLRDAINYIEAHLQTEVVIDDVAKAALSSKYHFQRMFHALTGFTVTEYIRNRRLTLAAEELSGCCKVIDTALKYGYDSPEVFTKAFTRLHGVSPSAARKKDVKLKSFPPLSFQIQIRGVREMNYRIAEEKGCTVIGKEVIVHSDPQDEVPRFVEQIWRDGTHDAINEAAGREAGSLLFGYHYDFGEDGGKRYLMGCELAGDREVPYGLTVLELPQQTYAVFEGYEAITEDIEIGTGILDVWRRIYAEWFPSAHFEQVEGPCIEKYNWLDEQQVDSKSEVWIPIRRKG
ncbi:AraC family transcriptional regulator [Fontibacillus phaseoli]|uniref:AraC family transcriptional regulator n=1 Tax=Fontibacillus phaseoli TaxID=1416533 RepID=A0A369B960_9BACL|nr:AraC family transcriptional regulator [Fontibacillus phaseoli]RCX18069.1 AraC family transcriptional regulator [Fontibacillus phaseoli]